MPSVAMCPDGGAVRQREQALQPQLRRTTAAAKHRRQRGGAGQAGQRTELGVALLPKRPKRGSGVQRDGPQHKARLSGGPKTPHGRPLTASKPVPVGRLLMPSATRAGPAAESLPLLCHANSRSPAVASRDGTRRPVSAGGAPHRSPLVASEPICVLQSTAHTGARHKTVNSGRRGVQMPASSIGGRLQNAAASSGCQWRRPGAAWRHQDTQPGENTAEVH